MRPSILLYLALIVSLPSVGCGSTAQWKKTSLPDSCEVYNIAAKDLRSIVVNTRCGLMATTDSGATWRVLYDLLKGYVTSFMYDKRGHLLVFYPKLLLDFDQHLQLTAKHSTNADFVKQVVLTKDGELLAASHSWEGVIRSTDGGLTWNSITQDVKQNFNHAKAITLSSSGEIFAGSSDGVYTSADGGRSWEPRIGTREGKMVVALAADSSGNIYTATDHAGVFILPKGDTAWIAVNDGLESSTMNAQGLKLEYILCQTILAARDALYVVLGSGVYRSTNEGDSWQKIDEGLPVIENRNIKLTSVGALGITTEGQLVAGTRGSGLYVLK